jgi:type II secretory pathway component GspD/PulD (secretin)
VPKTTYTKALFTLSVLMVFILPSLRVNGIVSLPDAHAGESPAAMQLAQSPTNGQAGQATVPQSKPVQSAPPASNGQPQTQAVPAPAAPVQAASPDKFPAQTTPTPRGGLVTLNFDDADVYSVIQTVFGDVLRVNYIVDPRVKGRVTFRSVAPVPRDSVMPLMEVVLRLNGIGLVEEGGLYRIIPIADIAKEPAPISIGRDPNKIPSSGKSLLQVVPIRYVSSTEVIRLLGPFLSAHALVVDVPKGNQIIIVDTDANVKRLLRLIEVFDNEEVKQKKPQIFVYHCQNGKAKDIASTLQQVFLGGTSASTAASSPSSSSPSSSSTGALSQSPPPSAPTGMTQQSPPPGGGEQLVSEITRIFPDEILNAVICLATPEDYELIKHTLTRIDIVPRQVVIEGIIAEVTLTDNLSLGMSYLVKATWGDLDMRFGLNTSNLDPAKTTGDGFTFVGTDKSGQLRAYITALATDDKAKLLASPHILVSDNREAKIQVGSQVPLVTSETVGTTGTTSTVQYKDIGIILKVKPRVNEGGLVSMEVSQEVSTFQTIPVGNVGQTQIIINKTEATTNLVVQNGQTIIIGGLIREDTEKQRSGIPWLSKLPLLGWLFGNTLDNKTRAELIILLTPHVMKDQNDAKQITDDYVNGMTEKSQGRIQKDELIKKEKIQLKDGATVQKTPAPPAVPADGKPATGAPMQVTPIQ